MIKIGTILFFLLAFQVLKANEKCIVPKILLDTIKITENHSSYPYYIRTNQSTTIKKFYSILESFDYRKTYDDKLIDCLNSTNCINISQKLILENVTNIDLGLFQINYNSYKYDLKNYFNEKDSYNKACEIIKEKINMHKGKWSWEVLASYHSMTPEFNKKYKTKLINNYKKILLNSNINTYKKYIDNDALIVY